MSANEDPPIVGEPLPSEPAPNELEMIDAVRPEYWFQGFGNDWLENFYELDSISTQLPSGIDMYLPSQWGGWVLALLLILLVIKALLVSRLERRLNVYRQEACEELAVFRLDVEKGRFESLAKLPTLLTRCLLVFNERADLTFVDAREKSAYLNSLLPKKAVDQKRLMTESDILFLDKLRFTKSVAEEDKSHILLVLSRFEYWLNWHQPERFHANT